MRRVLVTHLAALAAVLGSGVPAEATPAADLEEARRRHAAAGQFERMCRDALEVQRWLVAEGRGSQVDLKRWQRALEGATGAVERTRKQVERCARQLALQEATELDLGPRGKKGVPRPGEVEDHPSPEPPKDQPIPKDPGESAFRAARQDRPPVASPVPLPTSPSDPLAAYVWVGALTLLLGAAWRASAQVNRSR